MENLLQGHVFKKSVVSQLIDTLENFKEMNSLKTNNRLSDYFDKNSNVRGRSVVRILNKEISSPSAETVYHICCTIYGTKDYEKIISATPPAISKYIYNYVAKTSDAIKTVGSEDAYLFENQLALRIYYESHGYGTTLKTVQKKYGDIGIAEVNRLKIKNILKEDPYGNITLGSTRISNSPTSLARQNEFISKFFFRPIKSESGENFLHLKITSISPRAYSRIMDLSQKHVEEIVNIIRTDDRETPADKQTIKMVFSELLDKISED